MCQCFSHFFSGILHHFVMAKSATSSIRVSIPLPNICEFNFNRYDMPLWDNAKKNGLNTIQNLRIIIQKHKDTKTF